MATKRACHPEDRKSCARVEKMSEETIMADLMHDNGEWIFEHISTCSRSEKCSGAYEAFMVVVAMAEDDPTIQLPIYIQPVKDLLLGELQCAWERTAVCLPTPT